MCVDRTSRQRGLYTTPISSPVPFPSTRQSMAELHRMNRFKLTIMVFIVCGAVLLGKPAAWGVTPEWTRQLGTSTYDWDSGVSADDLGYVYISGTTNGDLGGTNVGASDAFVSKYDTAGNFQWTRQLGSIDREYGSGVSADGLGHVYVSGTTYGDLGTNVGETDAFVSKYDAAGNLQWTRQFGSSQEDESAGVSADGLGNVYTAGNTKGSLGGANAGDRDVFVRKYGVTGNVLWTRQFGTSWNEWTSDVSADRLGNVYVSGFSGGNLGGTYEDYPYYDAFVRKYNSGGNVQWTRQLGTSSVNDWNYGVSADGLGNVYISGQTNSSLGGMNQGAEDAYVSKYNAAGDLQWTRQLGTSSTDGSYSVSADGLGSVYVSGLTMGDLGGTNMGADDAFVSKYDAAGNLQWTRQMGTSSGDGSYGVTADVLGNVYISGTTSGSLGGPNAGSADAFLAKFRDVADGDFNGDGDFDCLDIDSLVAEIVAGNHHPAFDMTDDNLVNLEDRDAWLTTAGAVNLPSGNSYLIADANLDGAVDVQDFNKWNHNKFTSNTGWCRGDFNADGVVDVQDFIAWNNNKFTSADGMSAVPEPAQGAMLMALFLAATLKVRRVD